MMYVTVAIASISTFIILLLGKYPDSVYLYYLAALCLFLTLLHLLFSVSKYFQVYILPVYALLLLSAPIISAKIIYPYLISPRRFYAHFLKLDKDPWIPPGYMKSTISSHIVLFCYLYLISYITFKLICLRKCGIAKEDVLRKYSIRMTTLSYATFCIFNFSTSMASVVDVAVSWMPFKEDMISAIPMSIISILMLFLRYEPLMINDTCPQSSSSQPNTSILSNLLARIV